MLGIVALSFTACKKDKQTDDKGVVYSVEENAQADETFSDSFTDISSYATENDASFSGSTMQGKTSGLNILSTGDEPEISVTGIAGTEWPRTVTFNYGTGKTKNGVTKMGKIKAVFSNRFKIKGSKIYVTYEDYYINNHKIEGTKIITNNGPNPAGNYTFTVVVSKSKITDTKGSFTYEATHTIEWTKGFGTATRSDDEFSITGSSTGTNSKGITYTTTIIKPLIKKLVWQFFVAGSIKITAGDLERVLDYGDGTLDSKATYTYIGGPVVEIFLRK